MKIVIPSKFLLVVATWLPILLFGSVHAQNEVEDLTPLSFDEYFGGSNHDAYVSWHNTVQYSGSVYLPATNYNASSDDGNGAAVHWRVDETYLYVAVAARAEGGWVAVGIAEAGGMKGADIVYFESSKPDQLTDAHVLDERVPLMDDCQDWTLINVQNENGFLIFEGKRLLNTMDGQDHVIIDDSETMIAAQRIIAAWGETDVMQYHGPTNRARGSIRWYGTGDEYVFFRNTMAAKADGYFDLFVNNYTVAAVDTNYVLFCFNWDTDIVPQGVPASNNTAIIGAEIILDKEGGKFVHHAAVSASHETGNTSRTCLDTSKYDQFLYSWTPGALPLALPDDVGFTLGPAPIDGIQSFQVQIHYNNPSLIEGMRDNGGLRVYYTKTLPTHEAGILPLGDMLTNLGGTAISTGTSRFDFTCDKQCSSLVLDEPVTVIHEFFHMHNRGKAGVQYQIRDGEIVHQANVNFFDFDQTGVFAVRQAPYQIMPGDAFRTSCFIHSDDEDATFGSKSVNEMCNTVLLYYPAKRLLGLVSWVCIYDIPLTACNATYESSAIITSTSDSVSSSLITSDSLTSPSDQYLERTFGYNLNGECFDSGSTPKEESSTSGQTPSILVALMVLSMVTALFC